MQTKIDPEWLREKLVEQMELEQEGLSNIQKCSFSVEGIIELSARVNRAVAAVYKMEPNPDRRRASELKNAAAALDRVGAVLFEEQD
jgi:hypothetical protein